MSSKRYILSKGPSPKPSAQIDIGKLDALIMARRSASKLDTSPSVISIKNNSYLFPYASEIYIAFSTIGANVVGPDNYTWRTAVIYACYNAAIPLK